VYCLQSGLAFAASVTNCGGPQDHLSNVVISLVPDPIASSAPFTLTVSGVLDEDHVGGTLNVDLDVKALEVINEAVQKQIKYTISPCIPKGDVKIVIGPVTLPAEPAGATVMGKVILTDTQGHAVACVALDLSIPALEEARQQVALEELQAQVLWQGDGSAPEPPGVHPGQGDHSNGDVAGGPPLAVCRRQPEDQGTLREHSAAADCTCVHHARPCEG